mmetsp:Transcript_122476/g.341352  ORF Transcript_122476/g.341352 Transcript_122476/m.341352 type:complete len:98 (+) Transcript_122476:82-375(+)
MAKFSTARAALLSLLLVLGAASTDPTHCSAKPSHDEGTSILTRRASLMDKTEALNELDEDDGEEDGCPELCSRYADIKCTQLAKVCGGCDECKDAAP